MYRQICLFFIALLLSHPAIAEIDSRTALSRAVARYERLATQHPRSTQHQLNLGLAYLAVDALEQAAGAFDRGIEIDPDNYAAHYWLGRTYYLQEQYESAAKTFQELASIFPERYEAYADWGLALLRLYQYQEAEDRLNQAQTLLAVAPLDHRPLSPPPIFGEPSPEWLDKATPLSLVEINYYLAVAAFEQGRLDVALKRCEQSLRIVPSARAYFQHGLVLLRLGRQEQAEQAFQAAVELDSSLYRAHYQLALLYFKREERDAGQAEMEKFQELKRAAAAFEEQQRALLRNADKTPMLIDLGHLYLQTRAYEKADREFQKALWYDPDSIPALLGLAHADALQGHFDEGLKAYAKAMELAPDSPEVRATLGFILRQRAEVSQRQEDYQQALDAYRDAVEQKPTLAEAWLQRGLLALKLSQLPEARHSLETWLSLSEAQDVPGATLVTVHLALGEIRMRQGDLAAAEGHYKQVLRRDRERVEAYYNMGYIATRLKRLDQAVLFYEEVLKRKPKMAEVHYLLGRLYAQKGQQQKAEEDYLRAIELDPSLPAAHERLAHLYGTSQDLERALQHAQKAIALAPESAANLNTLSWIYYLRGDYQHAEQTIQQALERDPQNQTYRQGLEAIRQAIGGKR